ncbi:MAG: hypothetical protein K2J18_09605 [Paramuribaculum sp.]|nr:hypothetical protein [Paramuribaculum sp.]MDE7470845.1 hypothetical protein [Paramuribaculum sp.]
MNIPPSLMLTIGTTAGALFLAIFVISAIITIRNRKLIQKYSCGSSANHEKQNI